MNDNLGGGHFNPGKTHDALVFVNVMQHAAGEDPIEVQLKPL